MKKIFQPRFFYEIFITFYAWNLQTNSVIVREPCRRRQFSVAASISKWKFVRVESGAFWYRYSLDASLSLPSSDLSYRARPQSRARTVKADRRSSHLNLIPAKSRKGLKLEGHCRPGSSFGVYWVLNGWCEIWDVRCEIKKHVCPHHTSQTLHQF